MSDRELQMAIEDGRKQGQKALYFGCWERAGHFLHDIHGSHIWDAPEGFPWNDSLMDGGLLNNGGIPDTPDGRVFWTCGGNKIFWYAFYWWDRSVDTRGACNSGFYVRGFGWQEPQAAFDYACGQFPFVVNRQKHPLVLQNHPSIKEMCDVIAKKANKDPAFLDSMARDVVDLFAPSPVLRALQKKEKEKKF